MLRLQRRGAAPPTRQAGNSAEAAAAQQGCVRNPAPRCIVPDEAGMGGPGGASSRVATRVSCGPRWSACQTPERFPRFRLARAARAGSCLLDVRVREGEVLFLPALWFHRVGAAPGRVTVAVNYWHDMQFDARWVYFSFLQQIATADLELSPSGLSSDSDSDADSDAWWQWRIDGDG